MTKTLNLFVITLGILVFKSGNLVAQQYELNESRNCRKEMRTVTYQGQAAIPFTHPPRNTLTQTPFLS
jgi:hypothetical protein